LSVYLRELIDIERHTQLPENRNERAQATWKMHRLHAKLVAIFRDNFNTNSSRGNIFTENYILMTSRKRGISEITRLCAATNRDATLPRFGQFKF